MTPEQLEAVSWGNTSAILNVSNMKNFNIIEAVNPRTEGSVLVRIEVNGRGANGSFQPIGYFYYLINFFVPISNMTIENGTLSLYSYETVGDKFVDSNGRNMSIGEFRVTVDTNRGGLPTYIENLKIYVNEQINQQTNALVFVNNYCYVKADGTSTANINEAVLRIIRTRSGNTYTFNVQALKSVNKSFVLAIVIPEVNERKVTGIVRIFVNDAVEISDIEMVNVDVEEGLYFENLENGNGINLELVYNLYSANGRDLTNDSLEFEFIWDVVNITGASTNASDYVYVEAGKLIVNKNIGGVGKLRIYPPSNFFRSGWNGEDPILEIPIKIADGESEETAIEIYNANDLKRLNDSDKHFILVNNIVVPHGQYISDFNGTLNGKYKGINNSIVITSPLFLKISSDGVVKNINIIAVPNEKVDCTYALIEGKPVFGFLACLNEGEIIDVNIRANTNFKAEAVRIDDSSVTSTNIDAMGLLVGINKGLIKYTITNPRTLNVQGNNNGLNGQGAYYAGGIVGINGLGGRIDGATVGVIVTASTGGKAGAFAGDERLLNPADPSRIINCTIYSSDITDLYVNLNPNTRPSSEIVANENEDVAILYYYNVNNAELDETLQSALKTRNTFSLANLLKLSGIVSGGNMAEVNLSNFIITSGNNNIIKVYSENLEITGVGEVTLTITPIYSSNGTSKTITIYVLYPINSYEIYKGINTDNLTNRVKDNISVKNNETYYLTSSLKNTVILRNEVFTIYQNKLALKLLSDNFNLYGMATNYNKNVGDEDYTFYSTGTIAIRAKSSSVTGGTLTSSLVLQNQLQGNYLGNIQSEDFELINNLLSEAFKKTIQITVYYGAEKIESSITGAEIDPSNVLTVNVSLTTDDSGDDLIVEIVDEFGETIYVYEEDQGQGDIFEVTVINISGGVIVSGKLNFSVLIKIQDAYRNQISLTKTYKVNIYDSRKQIAPLSVNLTVKPQKILSVTYSHHNRDDSSSSSGLTIQTEPSSVLAPGDSGLLILSLFPTYANYSKIVIESEIIDSFYVLFEQMYRNENSFLSATGKSGYSSVRDSNKLTINFSSALANSNGLVYIRTFIFESIMEGLNFPIDITIYMINEQGEEVPVKHERIVLVTQVVDGAIITIDGEKEAVVVRGHQHEVKISVPAYQDLAEYSLTEKNASSDIDDSIGIYFDRTSYEIVNGRKVYTGVITVGLNAELTGDGLFKIRTLVSRIINGRLNSVENFIEIRVVDFLIKSVHIKGNNEEDNVFDTPLAIEKELEFEFVLTDTPEAYTLNQRNAVARIKEAKQYFLDNMAYRYSIGDYSYIINTDRTFVADNNAANQLTHIVNPNVRNSVVDDIYYTSDMTSYIIQQENQYFAFTYNDDGDISDFKSNLLKVVGKKVGSVPMTLRIGYRLPKTTYTSYITYNFVINVQIYSDEDKPVPIFNEQQFIDYLTTANEESAEANYILMNDLVLRNFVPFTTTNFKSLDGNNKIITIENFAVTSSTNIMNLALFIDIVSTSTVKNLTLNYYYLADIIVDENQYTAVKVGGLAINNAGIVYNCEVVTIKDGQETVSTPGVRVYFDAVNKSKAKKDTTSVEIAGLVVNNSGCITNSRVGGYSFTRVNDINGSVSTLTHSNINIIGQGNIAGFAIHNREVISSSYFANGNIINSSVSGTEEVTSGFVLYNYRGAVINGSYVKGIRLPSDLNIYVTGGGISAQGISVGFAYQNEGVIADSYTNIRLAGNNAGRIVSGFVYNNRFSGTVDRCYSASTIVGELTTRMPFTGSNAGGGSMQEVKNGLTNCYYIVLNYDTFSIIEEKFSTGATALQYSRLSQDIMYGFAFTSDGSQSQDGVWYWTGNSAELSAANNIAISVRRIIENYSGIVAGGQSVESINVFPYVTGYEYGSAKNPIIIRTADEYNRAFGQETGLKANAYYAISQMYDKSKGVVFGSYRLVSHIDFSKITIVENIKVASSIMTLTKKLTNTGSFDGNGLTISNIEITLSSRTTVGLISRLSSGAVFKNVNLVVKDIAADTMGTYVGGAVGRVEDSSVINVSVSPVISSTENQSKIKGRNFVGGVVGYAFGNSKLSNLTASISIISSYIPPSGDAGFNRYEQTRIEGGVLVDLNARLSYAGGVVGVLDIYENAFDSGVYTSKINVNKLKFYGENVSIQGKYIGGVVGYVGISTYLVDALFEVTGTTNFEQKFISYGGIIGGVVGINYGSLFEIRAEHQTSTQERIEKNLENYYNSPSLIFRGNTSLFNASAGTTVQYIGGLVGSMEKGDLTTSYSKIDVSNPNAEYAGGLIGRNRALTVFTELYTFGDVDGKYTGGLIGKNENIASFMFCVAMNFYNKTNSHFTIDPLNPPTSPISLDKLNAIAGKNDGAGIVNIIQDVYATKKVTYGGYTYKLGGINGVTDLQLSVIQEGDISLFKYDVDIIIANRMFLNAGWDPSLWVKDDTRLFPHLNFMVLNKILYIEKPIDLVKLVKYYKQDNIVIFGNDPGTTFNPYSYNDTDPDTFGEFASADLEGLTVIGTTNLEFDISALSSSLLLNIMNISNSYFLRFMGMMYGERDDCTYRIVGIEKTLFNEISGGTIRNLTFGESEEGAQKISLTAPVLALSISNDTHLEDLTFENFIITSSSQSAGIIANTLDIVRNISGITVKNCELKSTYETPTTGSVTDTVNVGIIAGEIKGTSATCNLTDIKITGTHIVVKGKEGKLAYNANVGMIFGLVTTNIIYTDCIIEANESSKDGIIEVSVKHEPVGEGATQVIPDGVIYVGGYAGRTSGTQTLINAQVGSSNDFIKDLIIVIGSSKKLYAGLLFGKADIRSFGNGSASNPTEEQQKLDITLSGIITNKHSVDASGTLQGNNLPVHTVAEVGGVVGNGGGDLVGITIKGLDISSEEDELILVALATKNIGLESETGGGATEASKIGGAVGYAGSALLLNEITICGGMVIGDESDDGDTTPEAWILSVGGAVGYTSNTFTIKNVKVQKDTVYNTDIIISNNNGTEAGVEDSLTVYAGGILGYAQTLNGALKEGEQYNIGVKTVELTSDGVGFDTNLIVEGAKVNYVGGIVGATSDAIGTTASKKVNIYDSKVAGNLEINKKADTSFTFGTITAGGIAGYIVGDIEGNYAWGNIYIQRRKDGAGIVNSIEVEHLRLGGIVGYLKGISSSNKSNFSNNNSLTSLYNISRGNDLGSGTHLVRALIAERDNNNQEGADNNYCHQINLAIDTFGSNLFYKREIGEQFNIISKFVSKVGNNLFDLLGNWLDIGPYNGSKLNPIIATGANLYLYYNYYFYLNDNITLIPDDNRNFSGHLAGDGFSLKYSGETSPFNGIYGCISGVRVEFESTFNGVIAPNGVAGVNNGIIFAITADVKGYTSTSGNGWGNVDCIINSGLVSTNNGLIADCGVNLNVKKAYYGFVGSNYGIISNSYAIGVVHEGADFAFNGYNDGKIFNSYTAIKVNNKEVFKGIFGVEADNAFNCYYDSYATEISMPAGTSKTTNDMSTTRFNQDSPSQYYTSILTHGTYSLINGAKANETKWWTQNYAYNYGYPSLSLNAYADFTGIMRFDTGDGTDGGGSVQIPNPGKLAQLQYEKGPVYGSDKSNLDYEHKYILFANMDLAAVFPLLKPDGQWDDDVKWTPIGNDINNFTRDFDGNNYKIINIPSISQTYAGFFGRTNGATIKNCDFIYRSGATVVASSHAGGVIGNMMGGTIKNVTSSGAHVKATSATGATAGGIVGYATSVGTNICKIGETSIILASSVEITNYNLVTSVNGHSDDKAGGILGAIGANEEEVYIGHCINFGEIKGYSRVGGIIGYKNDATEIGENCYNSGYVFKTDASGNILTEGGQSPNVVSYDWPFWSNHCSDANGDVENGPVDFLLQDGTVTVYTPKGLAYVAKQINTGVLGWNAYDIELANDIDLSDYVWVPINLDSLITGTGSNFVNEGDTRVINNYLVELNKKESISGSPGYHHYYLKITDSFTSLSTELHLQVQYGSGPTNNRSGTLSIGGKDINYTATIIFAFNDMSDTYTFSHIDLTFQSESRLIFDGKGHTIYGLGAFRNGSDSGLFGLGSVNQIQDLTIASGAVIAINGCAGGVVGYNSTAINIYNVINHATVMSYNSENGHDARAGGIIGYIQTPSGSNIDNCSNYGYIIARKLDGTGSAYAGQIHAVSAGAIPCTSWGNYGDIIAGVEITVVWAIIEDNKFEVGTTEYTIWIINSVISLITYQGGSIPVNSNVFSLGEVDYKIYMVGEDGYIMRHY
jgi:hypothetical protein